MTTPLTSLAHAGQRGFTTAGNRSARTAGSCRRAPRASGRAMAAREVAITAASTAASTPPNITLTSTPQPARPRRSPAPDLAVLVVERPFGAVGDEVERPARPSHAGTPASWPACRASRATGSSASTAARLRAPRDGVLVPSELALGLDQLAARVVALHPQIGEYAPRVEIVGTLQDLGEEIHLGRRPHQSSISPSTTNASYIAITPSTITPSSGSGRS